MIYAKEIVTQINPQEMQVIFLAIGSILMSIFGYFIRDLHRLVKTIHQTVTSLNTAVEVIKSDNKKDAENFRDQILEHKKRLESLEMESKQWNKELRIVVNEILKSNNII